jgi:hypothetical protein
VRLPPFQAYLWFCLLAAARLTAAPPAVSQGGGGPQEAGAQEAAATEKEPPFEKLLELNSEALFGAKIALKDGRFTLKLEGGGSFDRGFQQPGRPRERQGFFGVEDKIHPLMREKLLKEAAGKFSFAGLVTGSALSNFDLQDDYKVSFKIRIPDLAPGGRFSMTFNHDGRRGLVQTEFFQELLHLRRGSKKGAARTRDARFAGPPTKWFPTASKGVPVEIEFKNGRLAVRMTIKEKDKDEQVEVVVLEGIDEPTSGKLGFSFDKLSFLITDLSIEGKLPRQWVQQELDRLRQSGKLRTRPPEELARKDEARPEAARKKTGPDLDLPDPEAEDDL